jgi:hypothetical protein
MAQLISEIWEGLRDAGLPEVMLYLPDNSASRCHWNETALIGETRVALLADQDRKIVRILPVDACTGIGVASPKGTDPSGYKAVVQRKLCQQFGGSMADDDEVEPEPESPVAPMPQPMAPPPPPEPEEPEPATKADSLSGRFGGATRTLGTGNLRPGSSNNFRSTR